MGHCVTAKFIRPVALQMSCALVAYQMHKVIFNQEITVWIQSKSLTTHIFTLAVQI